VKRSKRRFIKGGWRGFELGALGVVTATLALCVIFKGSDRDGCEIQGDGLQMNILRRMTHFHTDMRFRAPPVSFFCAFRDDREHDNQRSVLHAGLAQRGFPQIAAEMKDHACHAHPEKGCADDKEGIAGKEQK